MRGPGVEGLVALLVGVLAGCGLSAEGLEPTPPGHLEYDLGSVRIYRDGFRVEHVPVLDKAPTDDPSWADNVEACFYLNAQGFDTIGQTVAALDSRADYPMQECEDAPLDSLTRDYLYIDGFEYSPFLCPVFPCYCHPELAPIAGVHVSAAMNYFGTIPTDEDGNELWYLDETRSCEPGQWRRE